MEFTDVLRRRCSVRQFEDTGIPDATIDHILKLAQLAPSAGNIQSYKVLIVRGEDRKKLWADAVRQNAILSAPVSFVICATPESGGKYRGRGRDLYSVQDATIFASYIQLVAVDMGLASVWIGAFYERRIAEAFKLPELVRPIAIICIGYPKEKGVIRDKRRKALSDIKI